MQRTIWGTLLGVLVGLAMYTQVLASPPTDSTLAFPKSKLGFSLILDNRDSFVKNSPVKIHGINVGVKYRKRYRIGLGAYTLRRNYQEHTYVSVQDHRDTLFPLLNLYFITPNFAYTVYNTRWVELSVPFEVGVGNSRFSISNTSQVMVKEKSGLFVPVSGGLSVLFKPTRWVGLSALAGYRKSMMEVDFKGDFDGWYYSYRVNIFLGNILADYRQYLEKKRQSKPPIQPSPEF
ncbi:MAG: hypothetical protein V4714_17270 [Bacteroidota bacterium]